MSGGCPAGFGGGSQDDRIKNVPKYRTTHGRVLSRMISCQSSQIQLAKCRERVAKEGHGACVTESKVHALCKQTQNADRSRIEAACLGPDKQLVHLERDYVQCYKSAWFSDCLGPLHQFADCAERLSQRPV
eukprot:m.83535 g.83535  ORF g.83535 m.83535 type:complete len:131 (+) comp9545_c3_seq2:252-644(+)